MQQYPSARSIPRREKTTPPPQAGNVEYRKIKSATGKKGIIQNILNIHLCFRPPTYSHADFGGKKFQTGSVPPLLGEGGLGGGSDGRSILKGDSRNQQEVPKVWGRRQLQLCPSRRRRASDVPRSGRGRGGVQIRSIVHGEFFHEMWRLGV